MLRKKLLLLLMLVTLLVSVATPGASAYTCSGDDCGCYIYFDECRADCHNDPYQDFWTCFHECRRQNIACSIACCG